MDNSKTNFLKRFLVIIIPAFLAGLALLLYIIQYIQKNDFVSPLGSTVFNSKIIEKPLDKYTVLNLVNYQTNPGKITIEKVLKNNSSFVSNLVSFTSQGKKITGMLNMPNGDGPFPVILMFRGYVDPTIYETGIGTQRAAEVFAQNGFITFAPDFLGYGGSDKQSENVMEERFETYTVALDSLAAIPTIENVDPGKIGIWAHSNGGQITITLLEATQKEIPTVLWAPVTKPFPYSVLYYTDEASDRGKFLRREIAIFEKEYEADLYSITDYVDRIKAKIQLHQGSVDEAVPQKWSNDFTKTLEDKGVDITYYTYPGADHNLMPSWNLVVQRNIQFFQENLK